MHIFNARAPHPSATRRVEEAPAAVPAPPGPPATQVDIRQLEKSVSWTRAERLRFMWYRFRLYLVEMNS